MTTRRESLQARSDSGSWLMSMAGRSEQDMLQDAERLAATIFRSPTPTSERLPTCSASGDQAGQKRTSDET